MVLPKFTKRWLLLSGVEAAEKAPPIESSTVYEPAGMSSVVSTVVPAPSPFRSSAGTLGKPDELNDELGPVRFALPVETVRVWPPKLRIVPLV